MEARLDVERILADFPAKNLRLATNRVVQDSAEGKYQYTCRSMGRRAAGQCGHSTGGLRLAGGAPTPVYSVGRLRSSVAL